MRQRSFRAAAPSAGVVDDIAVVRSMHTGHNGHEVSIRYFHGGIPAVLGRPTVGAWMVYGLGSESQKLPAYVVLADPGGPPIDGVELVERLFVAGLSRHGAAGPGAADLPISIRRSGCKGAAAAESGSARSSNRQHLVTHPGEAELEARIASYELAAKMQRSAKETLDIPRKPSHPKTVRPRRPVTKDRHPLPDRPPTGGARSAVRAAVPRGQPWDNAHESPRAGLPPFAGGPISRRRPWCKDLKARGMLDTTVVHWGGEIGRLPVTQNDGSEPGRDHNGQGFSMWLAGGGFRGGMTYGATDEIGHRAAENIVTPNDFQATMLHQFGLDHKSWSSSTMADPKP